MLIFRFLTALYFIGLFGSFYLPLTDLHQIYFLVSITALYVGISGWGSYQIRSQLYLKSFCQNKSAKNKVAITFDDGPDPQQTPEILDVLAQYNTKATFFMVGSKVQATPSLVKKIHQDGHIIGNHTFSHRNRFPLFHPRRIELEIKTTQEVIQEVTGHAPLYFRPPFGITNPLIAKAFKQFHLKTIGWSIRSLDTRIKDKQKVVDKVLKKVKSGDIILLHDTTADISWIVENILKGIEQKNLDAVSVDELLHST